MQVFKTEPIINNREETMRMCQEVFLKYAVKNMSVNSFELGDECEIKLRLFGQSEVKKFTKEQLKKGMVVHFKLIEYSVMLKGDSLSNITQELCNRIKDLFSSTNEIYKVRGCVVKVPELKAIQDFFFYLQMQIV